MTSMPQARPYLDAIEERVGVRRLADGARRDRPVPRDLMLVHQPLEALDRAEDGLHRARPDPTRRERFLAQRYAADRLFDHDRGAPGGTRR